jgi:7-cyano-7-deazaguanine synthase
MSKTSCLVVLSGGQDSTTCLFWAKEHYDEVHAITFDYGQLHRIEIDAAVQVAKLAGVASHEVVVVPNILRSTSPLTSKAEELERYEDHDAMEAIIGDRVEKTFVPMRNTLFLTVAMNRAVALGVTTLVTGICQADNANYPDCTDMFRDAFERMANESLGYLHNEFIVAAPLMNLSKAQSVKLAMKLPGAYPALAYSHTSYDGKYPPTDMNHANVLRAHGFEKAGVPDPLVIRAVNEGLMKLPGTDNYDEYTLTGQLPQHA